MGNQHNDNKITIMEDLGIKQMILQGPPGTSKTYGAKYDIIAPELPGGTAANDDEKKELLKKYQIDKDKWDKDYGWDMVQFHPSYSYEDFVRGITVSTKNDKVVYETVNKILGKMCKHAADHSEGKFFLIIDEINRADVATVFGELIYALECRGEKVSIPYGIEDGDKAENKEGKNETNYQLVIPDNLYIIGTMNTADKSIGTIDYAIRRRFLFFDYLPNKDVVEKYIQTYGETQETISNAINMMENLKKFIDGTINKGYHKKDFYIGHTYFLVKNKEELMLRLKYQIVPILREYYENGVLINDLNKMEEIKTRYPKLIEAIKGKDQSYDSQSDDSLFDALYNEII